MFAITGDYLTTINILIFLNMRFMYALY